MCHYVNKAGVPMLAEKTDEYQWKGKPIINDYEAAVEWMHGSAPDVGGALPPVF